MKTRWLRIFPSCRPTRSKTARKYGSSPKVTGAKRQCCFQRNINVTGERQSYAHVIFTIVIALWTGVLAAQNRPVPRNAPRVILEGRASVLHLAPRFTTTIRLPEPVSSVIVGDTNLFHVEHSPNEPL